MQWKSLLRLAPALVAAFGLTATIQVASRLASERAENVAQHQADQLENLAHQAEDIRRELGSESAKVDALADVILAAPESELEVLSRSLDVFEDGSLVRAIVRSSNGEHEVLLPDGNPRTSEVPSSILGLTLITEGRWAGDLSYRVYAADSSLNSAAVVMHTETLLDIELPAGVTEVTLLGLPGQPSQRPPSASFEERGSGVLVDRETGELLVLRELSLFNQPVTVSLEAEASYLAAQQSNEVALVVLAGIVGSLALAVLAWRGISILDALVAERDSAASAARRSLARFEASFANAPMGVVEIDGRGDIVVVNPRFASTLGYLPEELDGFDFLNLVDGGDREAAADRVIEVQSSGLNEGMSERRYRTHKGTAVWMRESMSLIDAGDGISHVLIQLEDISDERRTRVELHRKALYDELTGLANRANLMAKLRDEVAETRLARELLAVLFIDLDKFKVINDTLGHEAGDQVLIVTANRLRESCRAGDTVARLGGDEFVVLCRGIDSPEEARQAASRYFNALNQPTDLAASGAVEVKASVGLVVADGLVSPEELLRNADQAMYRAKASDEEGIVEFDSGMETASADRLSEEMSLTAALANGEFELHYQPIVNGLSGSVVGLEALVRWRHPRLGLRSPGEFLPLAFELGMMEDIDRWAIATGAAALAEWSDLGSEVEGWYLSINTTPRHYVDPGFADWVVDTVIEVGLKPNRLVLERPEASIYEDQVQATATIRQLRSRGVRISLDQFGVGQTTLADLATLEVDSLKIGRSFIRTAASREIAILSAIVTMADELNLEVVAEGIESQAELDIVTHAGVVFAQGFHFSRPLEGQALLEAQHLAGVTEPG